MLLEDMKDSLLDAHRVGRKLIEALSAPFEVCGGSARAAANIGASIGIAVQAPGQVLSPEDLIKEADRWMYEAKKRGAGASCRFRWRGRQGRMIPWDGPRRPGRFEETSCRRWMASELAVRVFFRFGG